MKEQAIRKALPGKLRDFRKRKGLTTIEVGEKIGKSSKTVSGWENGRGQPDADMLFRLCEVYGVENIAEFYTGVPDEAENRLNQDEIKLLDAYRKLDAEPRLLLLKLAEGLAGNPAMRREE